MSNLPRISSTFGSSSVFRAGLLYGLAHDWPLAKAACLGSLLGSIKIAERGGQNHALSPAIVRERFERVWGESFD